MSNAIVAYDASWLKGGGIARVANELISRAPSTIELRPIRVGKSPAGFFSPLEISFELKNLGYDLFWSPGFMPPAFSLGKPVVVTVHDLTHLHFYTRFHRFYYNKILRPLYKNCTSIITVSDFSRNEIIEWCGIGSDKVYRVYNGTSSAFNLAVNPKLNNSQYFLYPGNHRHYKNIKGVIEAFSRTNAFRTGIRFALTGDISEEIMGFASLYGVADSIDFLGFLTDSELASYYKGALFTIFVSKYEGFGLPVVEAMSVGCPVLCSNTTSLNEIAADAALKVDPADITEIANAIDRLAFSEEQRSFYTATGLKRSMDFDLDKSANFFWNKIKSLI